MAAPTSIIPAKQIKGLMSYVQKTFAGAQTVEIVAAPAAGKRIHVLGLSWTQASAGLILLKSATDEIHAAIADLNYQLPRTPTAMPREWLSHFETNPAEALSGTSTSNSRVTVWYTVE